MITATVSDQLDNHTMILTQELVVRSQHRASAADTKDELAVITSKSDKEAFFRWAESFYNTWKMFDKIAD